MMSTSTEEYLEALYKLEQEDKPVSTTKISKQLNIAPASVTEMMQKLANADCVHYSPYQGVTLTSKGYRIAEKMTWKHRLVERYLNDALKIRRNKLHEEACEMEHAISDETARAMCQSLNAPDRCPDDGQPIPPCDFDFSTCEECRKWGRNNPEQIGRREKSVFSIAALKENQEGLISFIRGDNKLIRKLINLGLEPGTRVRISRTRLHLDDEIANNVFVIKKH